MTDIKTNTVIPIPCSLGDYLAVEPPEFKKIEVEISSGFAVLSQKVKVIEVGLVLGFKKGEINLVAGKDKVILRGDAGVQQWAKNVLEYNGKQFVMCPLSQVIGYVNY